MRQRIRMASVALAVLAVAVLVVAAECSSDSGSDAESGAEPTTTATADVDRAAPASDPLDVTPAAPPPDLDPDVTFVQDLRCGDGDRSVIDVAVPADDGATAERAAEPDDAGPGMPMVINIHGGGFVGGDKGDVWGAREVGPMNELLDNGVAVASMNYSLLDSPDPDGVIRPLMDAARCLQFMRHHAPATFGVDPERIALRGGSAGAGTSLWLATHDDLADPDAEDPVLRQSTKPVAVVAHGTQATYDLLRWGTDVFGEYAELFGGKNLIELAEMFGLSPRLLAFYGITDAALLDTPEIAAYRADVDLLSLMDAEDPPAWISNTNEEDTLPITVGLLFHHSDHARALERQAAAVGYDATVTAGHDAQPSVSETDYLLDALGVSR